MAKGAKPIPWQDEMWLWINIRRVEAGVPPVAIDATLTEAAQNWADGFHKSDDIHPPPNGCLPVDIVSGAVDFDGDGLSCWDDRAANVGWFGITGGCNAYFWNKHTPEYITSIWGLNGSNEDVATFNNPDWTHVGIARGPWKYNIDCIVLHFGKE